MRSVKGASASASEPRNISPSPGPKASGLPRRAPIIRSCSPANRMASANAPSSRASAASVAETGSIPCSRLRVNELRHGLRVGLGDEGAALRLKLAAQGQEVLDDAVMDHRHAAGRMGVCIGLVGRAMRRPAGVADARLALHRLCRHQLAQAVDLAFGPPAADGAIVQHRDAGGVVAAIFEPLQPVDQRPCDRAAGENADDAAHLPVTRRRRTGGCGACAAAPPSPCARSARRAPPPARRPRHRG